MVFKLGLLNIFSTVTSFNYLPGSYHTDRFGAYLILWKQYYAVHYQATSRLNTAWLTSELLLLLMPDLSLFEV